jgi:probable F420-dependent oxidoreductase
MTQQSSRPAIAVSLSHVEPLVGPHCERLLELAVAADEAGIDQIVLSEHVTLAHVITGHPGPGDGHFPFPGNEQYPEPLVTLAAIAAVTKRARLSTNILIAPLRPAVLLAKMAATVDCLSGGRLDLGVGSGWHQDEFDALGVPMEGLPQRLEDTVRACQALWRQAPASFSSSTVSFTDMYCSPTPVNRDIPIWFGGGANRATARRVVELGRGWSPMGGGTVAEITTASEMIDRECERTGRNRAEVGIRVSIAPPRDAAPGEKIRATVRAFPDLVAAGATVIQLPLPQLVASVDEARSVLAEVVAAAENVAAAV